MVHSTNSSEGLGFRVRVWSLGFRMVYSLI